MIKYKLSVYLLLALTACLVPVLSTASAQPEAGSPFPSVPTGLRIGVFAPGFTDPTALAFGPDKRLYVGEQDGSIWVESKSGPQSITSGFATILGLAWHQHRLYVSSTGEVSELVPTNHYSTWSDHVIINGLPTGRHQNDGIVFLRKWMYLGLGSTCNACTESSSWSATILRFHDNGGHGQVYAHGLRNPFGLALQPKTHQLYATDNGRDDFGDSVPDEFNHIVHGGNYGWPNCWGKRHGAHCRGTISPVAELPPHSSADGVVFDSGASLGAKYAGDAFIAEFGDQIDSLGTGHAVQVVRLGKHVTVSTFATGFQNPLAVAMSPKGKLVVADYGTGTIWQITGRR